MSPRRRAILQIALLCVLFLFLFRVFPRAFSFVELAARELRYLWWIVLLVALAAWLIWGVTRKPK